MKKYHKFSITLLTGIMVGSSAHSALSSIHPEREDGGSLPRGSLLSTHDPSSSQQSVSLALPEVRAKDLPILFSYGENVHAIAPRIKRAGIWGAFVHNDDISNINRPIELVTQESAVEKLIGDMDFIKSSVGLSFTVKERDGLINTAKKFWQMRYDKIALDPETGAQPLELFSRCIRLADNDPEGFSFFVGALTDAADPQTGGLCLQGYTVRLLAGFNSLAYNRAQIKLNPLLRE
ncbi:MAG: hypothetical protein LBL30_01570 [Holosporales bacterium]|jgi:hypothetical protein|nr:hypothetical protein [Holosporales bacterium]